MVQKSKKELAQAAAEKAGLSAAKAESLIDAFFKEIESSLAEGDEVNIPGYLKLYADDMPPRAAVDAKTGKRTVTPVKRTVKAKTAKALRDRVAETNKVKGTGIILAATPEDEFAVALVKSIAHDGVKCVIEPDVNKAVKVLGGRAKVADFVVIAPSVRETDYEEMVLQVKTHRATSFLPVLRGAIELAKYDKPEGFKILPEHVFSTATEAARQIKGDLDRWREEKHYFKRQFKLKSASNLDTIHKLFGAFDTLAGRILPGADDNYKLLSALHEAIENAAQHGNKGDVSKYVSIDWIEDNRNVMITVKDEGTGFDYKAALETAKMESPEAVRHHMKKGAGTGGLGIKLVVEVFDTVEYADGGRTLHLTRKKKS